MEEKKPIKTIYEKLIYIQQNLNAPKSQYNKFGGYNYRNCEDILKAVKPLLDKVECSITLDDDIIKYDDRFYVVATAELSNNRGDTISKMAFAREALSKKGMDVAQITGAASSYARKYALNGLLAIDDARDPDNADNTEENTTKSKQKPKQQNKPKNNNGEPNQEQTKMLNFIIETLAKQAEEGQIVDIDKLKKAILDKYGQYPTKQKSAKVVIDYVINELGLEEITTGNDFMEGLA